MCGIAGILRIHDPKDGPPPHHLESIPEAWLDTLDESIKHRGPDGAGRFRDRAVRADGLVVDVALVHRRLSIIDHAGGHQPMVHDGERLRPDLTYGPGEMPKVASEIEPEKPLVAVVFNGCIYNHRELRAELESLGHRFETDHSDTEVLVHGWRDSLLHFGPRLDGMYAVSCWNRATGQASTARDRTGEKPLYMALATTSGSQSYTRVFCTHLSALARPWLDKPQAAALPRVLRNRFEYWLRFGAFDTPPVPAFECPPAQWGIMPRFEDLRDVQHLPVWARSASRSGGVSTGVSMARPATLQRPYTCNDLGLQIEHAITSRLEADVPLGVFLSGGIDSALIAAITKRHRPDIKTFTVRMPEASYDESVDAAETAAHIGTDHHTLDCDAMPAEDLVMLIEQLGLPFGDSSLLPTYWVSKAAREH
ncbi:MAG: asparagine synthase-related protein, partial [Planctomycetota bacterium]